MVDRYHRVLRSLEREVDRVDRLSRRIGDQFREIDAELQLAGRLQRDFLPRIDAPIQNLAFATIYKPASWVSGDMYDVIRIDEDRTGVYVADAVGHGAAAGLLTMFIKRAIVPVGGDGSAASLERSLADPSAVIASLNDALVAQALPNNQFVTACYAVFHHPTRTMRYARGGHPYPVRFGAGGELGDIPVGGGLLGVFPGATFETTEVTLRPADKVLFYTDGVELAFPGKDGMDDSAPYRSAFARASALPLDAMLAQLNAELDAGEGSLAPRDDVTIVGMQVLD
jgi:sigma-B regulation protein RsbU (phosphoserine phosphatase)